MNKAKLTDTHNRINGENSEGFTREGRGIRTRIDRIYAKENNSTLAWEHSEINYDIVSRIHTDHFPVIATAAALGRSKNKPHQDRINTVKGPAIGRGQGFRAKCVIGKLLGVLR